ncbi:MAG: helix-turn-helix domain-containing protein [Candidatus Dormiibacterota bacterium]
MTREETRARIVDAAFRSLVDGGYHDTTIKDIADEAGIATGLAHYYFDNKDDLLLAALERGCPMADIDLSGMSGLEQAELGFAAEKQGQIWNQDAYKLVFDMVGAAMSNPKISERIRLYLGTRREFITEITEAVMKEAPERPRASSAAIGGAIWSAFLGVALQRLIDPDFDGDAAIDALQEMAGALAGAPR